MGSTIRREPVVFNIPDAPDYKFLNVTNFGGLSITDNPLQADYRTASDCKNVYIDETDALSTRPRLQIKYKSSDLFSESSYEILNFYSLSDGYLVHYKTISNMGSTRYKMIKISNEGQITNLVGTIPQQKIYFIYEKDNVIYLSFNSNIYTIKENIISLLDNPYIPVTKIGYITNTGDIAQISYEGLNLLSENYKETLFWNGEDKLNLETDTIVEVNNEYYKKFIFSDEDVNFEDIYIGKYFTDDTFIGYDRVKHNIIYGIFSNGSLLTTILLSNINIIEQDKMFKVSADKTTFGFITQDLDWYVYLFDKNTLTAQTVHTGSHSLDQFPEVLGLTADGRGVLIKTSTDDVILLGYTEETGNTLISYNFDLSSIPTQENIDGYILNGLYGTHLFHTYYTDNMNVRHDKLYYIKTIDNSNTEYTSTVTPVKLKDFSNTPIYENMINLSYNDKIMYLYTGERVYTWDFSSTEIEEKISDFGVEITEFVYSIDGTQAMINNLYLIPDISDMSIFYPIYPPEINGSDDIITFLSGHVILVSEYYGTSYVTKVLQFQNSSEPLLTIIYKISEDNTDWSEKRTKFLQSHLVTRFENNWWFASGNRVYHTENNDPTYISEFSYSDVGDSKEDITGFNIVDNSTLIIYKKNSIYSIQSAAVEDINTYVLLESKNTVGNNAVGAPIITTLTELPIHISYNGIFALNQLPDVQSSDRIATLISTGINPKWLKEDKTIIDNAITFNYLYWTYIVLKYTDLTKVYVIDNRTSNWFYWELPINCLTAYCKDNKIEFVDTDGNVMTMETEDIYTNENDTNNISYTSSAYYDLDKQIIDWYWRSQILYLGTINYSKRLVNTTFIVADTDTSDEYSLDYKFKAFRKVVSETDATTLSDTLNYVQSVTKKTVIPRFKFLQIEVANTPDDLYNNKLRLIGLSLKYVLLESML